MIKLIGKVYHYSPLSSSGKIVFSIYGLNLCCMFSLDSHDCFRRTNNVNDPITRKISRYRTSSEMPSSLKGEVAAPEMKDCATLGFSDVFWRRQADHKKDD